ncbi:MAG: AsmA family protein, partial [Desulfobacula sp.]|nr:AsmA family protein [Desulfobacula sp.]
MAIKAIFLKKKVLIPCAIVVLYTLVGFFLLPVLGKNILKDKLSESLNRQVTIEKIAVNPYALTVTIDALVVKDKNSDVFFSTQKIFANLSISTLFTFTIVVSDISLESPYVNIIRNTDESFNFSDLLTSDKSDEKPSENKESTDKEIIGFIVKNVSIIQGEIAFTDKAAKVSHLVKDFSLSLPFLSS